LRRKENLSKEKLATKSEATGRKKMWEGGDSAARLTRREWEGVEIRKKTRDQTLE